MPCAKADPDLNKRFLEQLVRRAIDQGFTSYGEAKIAPRGDRHDNLRFGSGYLNVLYHYRVPAGDRPYVQVSIYDEKDRPRNDIWFKELSRSQQAIEEAFGNEFEWEYEPIRNLGAYVRHHLDGDEWPISPTEWSRLQDSLIEAMRRLRAAVQPYLDAMPADIRHPT